MNPDVYTAVGYELVPGEDYRDRDDDPLDRQGHGTHVAGIAAAAAGDGRGMAGVAWNASIMAVRTGFALGLGDGTTTGALEDDDVAAAITWAADSGADILNMSFGGGRSALIDQAVDYAWTLGSLLVASAGNIARDVSSSWPAANRHVLSVGATDVDGTKAAFSNWGATLDAAAPGYDILSTRAAGTLLADESELVGPQHIRASGTSMAAPQVAGAAALLWSSAPARSRDEIRGRLLATAQGSEMLIDREMKRVALGAGIPDLPAAFADSGEAPWISLVWLVLDPLAGFRASEAGAWSTETLDILLRNVGPDLGAGLILELMSNDPYVVVVDNNPDPLSFGWLSGISHQRRYRISLSPEIPRYYTATLQMRISRPGEPSEETTRRVEVPILLHGSRPFVLRDQLAG
ncbi:MAG: S8 family serine peptidase, partial [Holophagales bacterium]|nr:S8 family serine peptidase [Holophagales bacterium]